MARSRELWSGPAGPVEVLLDVPGAPPKGVILLAHPHPLLGGTPGHKVTASLASQLCADGWSVVRPSFRGVGATAGTHDHGEGEADDLCAMVSECRTHFGLARLALVGYSFGAYVQARTWRMLNQSGNAPAALVLIATGVGEVAGSRTYDLGQLPGPTLVIHGECDEQVSLSNVLRWAEPLGIAVTTIPGADHAFSHRLTVLGRVVVGGLRGAIDVDRFTQ